MSNTTNSVLNINPVNKENAISILINDYCVNGKLKEAKSLLKSFSISIDEIFRDAFLIASKNSQIKIVEWLFEIMYINRPNNCSNIKVKSHPKNGKQVKSNKCRGCGTYNYNEPRCLICDPNSSVNKEKLISILINDFCANGKLEEAKSLLECFSISIYEIYQNAFPMASKNGQIAIVQWLFESMYISQPDDYYEKIFKFHPKDIYYQGWHQNAFILACGNGQLEMAKYLYNNKYLRIYIEEQSFLRACENNHLEVAKWLYPQYKGKTNSDYKYAFKNACKKGSLEVVQWIYEVKHDISLYPSINRYDLEECLISSCFWGKLNIVQWLYSLCNYSDKVFNKALEEANTDYPGETKPKHPDIYNWLKFIRRPNNKMLDTLYCFYTKFGVNIPLSVENIEEISLYL